MRWLVTNRIPAGKVSLLSGDGATGKTTIALQLAVAVAVASPDWLGSAIETPGPVIFVSAEEDEDEIQRRLGRSEEHTSELQSHLNLVCRLLLEKKKKHTNT